MAGAGYKLFNTGDVLTAAQVNTYLMEQSVMVFANAAARTTALSGVVAEGMLSYLKDTDAVEVYNGSAWVASDDPNAIQNTIVDAKGDLISATANDTPARLAVGNNGETLVADSSATTGLRWQASQAAGRNFVINGGFDVWQRGTSIAAATTAGNYGADRWTIVRPANAASITLSRQATSDTTNLPFFQYCARIQRTVSSATTDVPFLNTSLESVNSIPLAGRTITFSFYARAGANYSSASSVLNYQVVSGTGTDQNVYSGFTGAAAVINTTATLTTTWQRFQATAAVGSTATQLGAYFYFTPVGTAGANDYFEVTGVQLEVGSVATQFTRTGGTLAGELALAQRYYLRTTANATYAYVRLGTGTATSTTAAAIQIPLPVTMRGTVTTLGASNLGLYSSGSIVTVTSLASDQMIGQNIGITANVASGLTQDRAYQLIVNNSSTGYLELGAEL